MTTVTIHRSPFMPHGTFGVMYLDSKPIAVTLEDPWKDNARNESCIPHGTYRCVPHNGKRFQSVWEVTNVPGRSAILIHAGNTSLDTQGCILVGRSFGEVNGLPAVLNSVATLQMLRERLPKEFNLTIT